MRSKQRSQAVVEFGLIAILFTGLMFAVVDFGLLLNTWLNLSSGTRQIARDASVGKSAAFLTAEATNVSLPSIDWPGFATPCCSSTSAVFLTVEYFNHCVPETAGCAALDPSTVSNVYYGGTCGGCTSHPVSDDYLKITFVARGAQVITPLLRPFFGCTDGSNPRCHVRLPSTTIIRFEGQEF